MNTCLCVPTLNASETANEFSKALKAQVSTINKSLIIDSTSSDGSLTIWRENGMQVHHIPRTAFNHGGTRQLAVELCPYADIIVFMTQDAFLTDPHSLQNLLAVFNDPKVGVAYGRQLPARDANSIAAHARLFNYSSNSYVRGAEDIPSYGLKTTFLSNSFAAYRRSALEVVGGFPRQCIVSEDTYVAAKMLLSGWKVAYCAEAKVYHSHNYNWRQDFQRYFDVGVFHAREPWVRKEFGGAEGEGIRFLTSEMKYLLHEAPHLIPSALVRSVIKYLGFRSGLSERLLPRWLKVRLSMQKAFWLQ